MLKSLFSNRLFIGALAFFVFCVCGSLLYSWHVHRTTESDMARHDQFLQGINENETRPVEAVNVPNTTETPNFVDTPEENTDTPMPNETEVVPNETETLDITDAFLPDDMVSEEEAPAEDVPVSPFGFGPYPEVPTGYPTHLLPVWLRSEERQQRYTSSRLESFELMDRVLIKLWNQGDRDFDGVMRDNHGKVYPLYKDIIYVTWAELKDENGKIIGTYARNQLSSHKTQRISFRDHMEGKIPSNIQFMDREASGIDPYMFLGLQRR